MRKRIEVVQLKIVTMQQTLDSVSYDRNHCKSTESAPSATN